MYTKYLCFSVSKKSLYNIELYLGPYMKIYSINTLILLKIYHNQFLLKELLEQ